MAKKLTKGSLLGFVRSRPYISVADLRRRFRLETDDAAPLHGPETTVYVGLPRPAADMLQELWLAGLVGLHLSPNLRAPAVEGVYPMQIIEGKRRKGKGGQAARSAAADSSEGEGGQAHEGEGDESADEEEE